MANSLSFANIITPGNVAQAAMDLMNEENIIKDLVLFKSHKDSQTYRSKLETNECFWKKVCRKIMNQKTSHPHRETMKKYAKRVYDLVRRPKSFGLVNELFEALKKKIRITQYPQNQK